MSGMGFRGAIFDVDGVLVDSRTSWPGARGLKELMKGEWRDIGDRTSWTPQRFTPAVYSR